MRRVIVTGAVQLWLANAPTELRPQAVDTKEKFRKAEELTPVAPPAPQFGGARPYLKKKKGRA